MKRSDTKQVDKQGQEELHIIRTLCKSASILTYRHEDVLRKVSLMVTEVHVLVLNHCHQSCYHEVA